MKSYLWEGIVKVQRPLFDSRGDTCHCLVYNEDKTVFQDIPFSARDQRKLFDEDEFKVYCLARINKRHMLEIMERVDEQDW